MSLFKFFKPKWQHSDPLVRLTAVRKLLPEQVELLEQIIREDEDPAVRQAALAHLGDQPTLARLAESGLGPELHERVEEKLFLLDKASILSAVTLEEQKELLAKYCDPRQLLNIAAEAGLELRLECIRRMEDQDILAELLTHNWGKEPALAAVAKLSAPEPLARAMKMASNKAARRVAEEKYKALDLELHPPDPATILTASLQELLRKAREAATAEFLVTGKEALTALRENWLTLDPDSCHPLSPEFRHIQEEFEERWLPYKKKLGKQEQRAQLRAEQLALCEASCQAIELLLEAVGEEVNKSFQAAARQWQTASANVPGGIPHELQNRYTNICQKFQASRQTIAGEIAQRDQLAAQLAQLALPPESKELKQRLDALDTLEKKLLASRFQFLPVKALREELVALRHRYQERQEEEAATRARLRQENIDRHQQLLTELESLLAAEDRLAAEIRVKEAKGIWSALPPLPPEESAQHLRYKELLDQFYQGQRQFHEEQSWQQWANQTKKEELIQLVEALGQEEDPRLVFRVLKEAQNQWRELGPVPPKVAEKIWARFRAACDRNFQRCKSYFEELEKQAEGNRLRKEELLRQAEACQGSTAWQTTAETLKKLQAEWKEVGPAGKSEEGQLSRRFNGICDAFFAARKFHLAELNKGRQANLSQKEALCQEAEKLVAAPLPGQEGKIQELQAQWKTIGPVPKEQSEPLWQRFRGACDRYFQWLDERKPHNLAEKVRLCQEVEELVAGINAETNYKNLAREILARQNAWKEIGPVPKEGSEEVWQRFRAACELFFNLQREQFEEREKIRQGNEERKLGLIHEMEQLIGKTDRESGARAQDLQQTWLVIGPATKDQEKLLQQRFKEAADHFFNDRRALFANQDAARQENLKKKERLCVRLEVISKQPHPNTALNLAEQLKLAMESNFMLSGQDPEQRRKLETDEINLIKQEWQLVGPVPHAQEQKLHRRFQAALAASGNQRPEKAARETAK